MAASRQFVNTLKIVVAFLGLHVIITHGPRFFPNHGVFVAASRQFSTSEHHPRYFQSHGDDNADTDVLRFTILQIVDDRGENRDSVTYSNELKDCSRSQTVTAVHYTSGDIT